MPPLRIKVVILNDVPIGEARTWIEAAHLLSTVLKHAVTPREAQDNGSEGPDGFYVNLPP
jgi:hypothetical protein